MLIIYIDLFSLLALQVLALVFVRKVLDLCFSKRELSYLDDLMPEWKKKKLDDASKKIEEVAKIEQSTRSEAHRCEKCTY